MSLSQKRSAPKATVVLLTRNSAKTIRSVLDGIVQQCFSNYEILLIDSSSEDDTVKIAREYPCRVVIIKPEEFGHGKTRNYAASLVKGEFVVFITHDSVPRTKNWLSELLKPFSDPKVVGVYGRQVPREDEKVLDKCFQSTLYGNHRIIWKTDNWHQGDNLFSDANSALRRNVFLKYPYHRDIIVSEDYEWAVRMLSQGYNIVYEPSASVIHSHSYSLKTLFKRNFDVGVSYKTIYANNTVKGFTAKGFSIVKQEIVQLFKTGKGLLMPLAILRDAIRFIAIQLGKREQFFSKDFKQNYLSAQSWYWK